MKAIIAKDKSDPFLKELKSYHDDIKIFYCPTDLFVNDSLKCLPDIAEVVYASDVIYKKVSEIIDGEIWPTSQWQRAAIGKSPVLDKIKLEENRNEAYIDGVQHSPILFVPDNDTHIKMFYPVARKISNKKFLICNDNENAGKYLHELGEEYIDLGYQVTKNTIKLGGSFLRKIIPVKMKKSIKKILNQDKNTPNQILQNLDIQPAAIVFGNDWSYTRKLIDEAKILNIPTICLQEGPQDFDLPYRPMMHAEYVFLEGVAHAMYLERNEFFITGNPRLENIDRKPLPDKTTVMINANFTYGVCEEYRDVWMSDVVDACRQMGVNFFISKHPRDYGEYRGLPVVSSDAFKIQDQLANASVIVTRFSSVLYEALAAGRTVIYYNPHSEVKKTLTRDKTGAILYSCNEDELLYSLREAVAFSEGLKCKIDKFMHMHCGPQDGFVVSRIVQALASITRLHIN